MLKTFISLNLITIHQYISNISQDKCLSPKTNYNFQNEYVIKDYSKPSDSIHSEKSIKSSFAETGQNQYIFIFKEDTLSHNRNYSD